MPEQQYVLGPAVPGEDRRIARKLLIRDLGLLDGDHIDVAARQPRGQPVDPSTDRIDVPGGNTHSDQPKTGAVAVRTKNGTVIRGGLPVDSGPPDQHLSRWERQPGVEYSTTCDRVGNARRGTPLPRKSGSSICSVCRSASPGSRELRRIQASSSGVPFSPSRTTSNAYCSLNSSGGKVRLTTRANAAETPVPWSRPIAAAAADHLQLAQLIGNGVVGEDQRHRCLFEDLAHGTDRARVELVGNPARALRQRDSPRRSGRRRSRSPRLRAPPPREITDDGRPWPPCGTWPRGRWNKSR